MSKRIAIGFSILLLVIVILLRSCRQGTPFEPSPTVPKAVDVTEPPSRTKEASEQQAKSWQPTEEELRAITQTEAVFYGKVIDQFGDPVPNAEITYIPNYDPWNSLQRRIRIRTATDGRFSIREQNAPSINICVEHTPGYYSTDEAYKTISFSAVPASTPDKLRERAVPPYQPDPGNPVVFTLKKMGLTEPMIHRTKSVVLGAEQEFLVGTDTRHVLHVKYWLDPALKRTDAQTEQPIYDWGVEFSVAGGGLLERANPTSTDPASFEAPTEGYQEHLRLEYVSSMDARQYRSEINGQYFVRFSDGKYARVEVRLRSNPKRPFGTVESWFKPSGNRATEFDPAKEIKTPTAR